MLKWIESTGKSEEAAIEAAICAKGLLWAKEDRYWLQSVQRYQVVYTFDYYEKRRM